MWKKNEFCKKEIKGCYFESIVRRKYFAESTTVPIHENISAGGKVENQYRVGENQEQIKPTLAFSYT